MLKYEKTIQPDNFCIIKIKHKKTLIKVWADLKHDISDASDIFILAYGLPSNIKYTQAMGNNPAMYSISCGENRLTTRKDIKDYYNNIKYAASLLQEIDRIVFKEFGCHITKLSTEWIESKPVKSDFERFKAALYVSCVGHIGDDESPNALFIDITAFVYCITANALNSFDRVYARTDSFDYSVDPELQILNFDIEKTANEIESSYELMPDITHNEVKSGIFHAIKSALSDIKEALNDPDL